jgi:phosphate transport system protein
MTHLDTELKSLKSSVVSMWLLVISQLEKAEKLLTKNDEDLIHEIKVNEKRVDAFELKLNMDCENILALFNPVAIDLRFVVAVLKINYNLERIGDYARSMVEFAENKSKDFDRKFIKSVGIKEMFGNSYVMLNDALSAFEQEDARLVKSVFQLDKEMDKYAKNATDMVCEWIQNKSINASDGLYLHSVVRKLERVGDQAKNIATEIIFHTEARMVHHTKKKQIMKELDDEKKEEKLN